MVKKIAMILNIGTVRTKKLRRDSLTDFGAIQIFCFLMYLLTQTGRNL